MRGFERKCQETFFEERKILNKKGYWLFFENSGVIEIIFFFGWRMVIFGKFCEHVISYFASIINHYSCSFLVGLSPTAVKFRKWERLRQALMSAKEKGINTFTFSLFNNEQNHDKLINWGRYNDSAIHDYYSFDIESNNMW